MLARVINIAGRIPFIGDAVTVWIMLAPAAAAVVAYQLSLMVVVSITRGAALSELATSPALLFPGAPRAAGFAASGALAVAGLATIWWGKTLRRQGGRPRFLFIPWRWWGRLMVTGALATTALAVVAPDMLADFLAQRR